MIVAIIGRTYTSYAYASIGQVGLSSFIFARLAQHRADAIFIFGPFLSSSDSTYAHVEEVRDVCGDAYAFLHELPPATSPLKKVSLVFLFTRILRSAGVY